MSIRLLGMMVTTVALAGCAGSRISDRVSGALRSGPTSTAPLAAGRASASRVQQQPAAGSCRVLGRGVYVEPDPRCTPGAINPTVTQATINQTICRDGWTATVRPPESITETEKRASMEAYGDVGSMHAYEYDHLIPLELGGASNDPQNLWPEPGGVPNPKDAIENQLNALVCDRKMTLARARWIIAREWVRFARRRHR